VPPLLVVAMVAMVAMVVVVVVVVVTVVVVVVVTVVVISVGSGLRAARGRVVGAGLIDGVLHDRLLALPRNRDTWQGCNDPGPCRSGKVKRAALSAPPRG
jgi:hypothetical protein